ncbi:MAG: hypothetical protein UX72_C0004G0072 [Parcubacteria group bacterium GW2011_GWA2_47_10]|nr:MAG: hypothetical protein UX72_C0004G0072 [Parcubacteria group bacterium GW2011_GWA2_47_10]
MVLTWWFWLPPVLCYGAWESWKYYLKKRYFAGLSWVLLEVRIPKMIAKPPQAMEQIFAGLHAGFRHFDFEEKYWLGLQTDFFCFEIVSVGGRLHFYAYVPTQYRNLFESLVYSQYPESEIKESEDYLARVPDDIPNETWNLYGSEFALAKPDPYPIRTYKEFVIEDISSKEEMRKVDPLSALAEVLAKIKPNEIVSIQLLIRPVGDDWKKEGERLVAKMIGKEIPNETSGLAKFLSGVQFKNPLESFGEAVSAHPYRELEVGKEKSRREGTLMQHLSPGEKDVVTAIGRNITKLGFETVLRFAYIGRTDEFDMMNFAAMNGVLRQFNTQDLNSFKVQTKALTTGKWYNPWRARVKVKRKRIFFRYVRGRKPFSDIRLLRSKPFVFNIEELATIYHFPGETVGAFTTQRVEAKRGEPPADLPM